jgi:superfamily II DNA or RNA helicase
VLPKVNGGGWHSAPVWAASESYGGNSVKQLLVPGSIFQRVTGSVDAMRVANAYGEWPAASAGSSTTEIGPWLELPLGSKPGDALTRASWWPSTSVPRSLPAVVSESYRSAIGFEPGTDDRPGLRSPQLGAVHAALGYWTTKNGTPATVVMPTGTGKTETMLALLVAGRLSRILVLVPSDVLREQTARKFERLGVLQELGIVSNSAQRPIVGRLEHRFDDAQFASDFADACNVVVATPQSLHGGDRDALDALLSRFSHLFVDEAHHVAARTWSDIRDQFSGKDVVQFTATPFREDGRHLQGRIIYSFPLREAQAQGYFSTINYTSVVDFEDADRALAAEGLQRLREDHAEGFDHTLLARVNSIPRAVAVKRYYDELAADLNPVIVNSHMPKGQQRQALSAIAEGRSRVIVCVNMLGEGFDLPSLKVAAVHDPQKSLAVTLQFIGRFARTSSEGRLGEASIFVARRDMEIDRSLRELYAEDSDWNLVLRNLTEAAVGYQEQVSDFEAGFTSKPEEIALRSVQPKLSTVVYRAPNGDWEPHNILEFFGEANVLTIPIGLNPDAAVAWCVLERHQEVRWGQIKSIEDVVYELYVLYFDRKRRLLYINNSANDGVFQELAESVVGVGAVRFTGSTVYRVMANIDRLVPTNVGVVDVHDQFRRFSMHVGSDVTASFSQAEAGTKSQTNISGGGYRDGEHVNISASLKGRIWSHATAQTLKHWVDWCDGVGTQLLDDSISIESVIGQFVLPERLVGRPPGVLLAVEWPWKVHDANAESLTLSLADQESELAYADLVPETGDTGDVFRFAVRTAHWAATYEAAVVSGALRFRNIDVQDVVVKRARSELLLTDWLNENGVLLVLDDDRIVQENLIFKPTWDKPPYDSERLTVLDWTGTRITVESQTKDKLPHSIQYRSLTELKKEDWDVILDDDGTGEIADIVALRIDAAGLLVRLVHCKYSHGAAPGARVEDLYEVCGQAQKSIMWRRNDLQPFFRTLHDRARKKQQRDGVSPFEAGDLRKLFELRDKALGLRRRMEIVIAQPGLSHARVSTQQLDLLASTQAYLLTTVKAPLCVWCSS